MGSRAKSKTTGAASGGAAPFMDNKGAKHAWNYIDRDPDFGASWSATTVVT
jgi:hypothetical protein